MEIAFYGDLAAFRQRTGALLRSRCALNSLKLGILEYYQKHGEESGNRALAVGVHQGVVIAAFVLGRSLYFSADEAYWEEIIPLAVEELDKRQIRLPSVMGHGETALRFAECWRRKTQSGVTFAGKDCLYELTSIGDGRPARGRLRRAASSDVPQLEPLFTGYYREDLGVSKTGQDLEQELARLPAEDEVYFWDDDGAKSMATALLPYDGGVELANVFTPQEHRNKGYATACIHEVCRTLLQQVPRVVLFVDQDNSPANALYRKIGFRLVDTMSTYAFEAQGLDNGQSERWERAGPAGSKQLPAHRGDQVTGKSCSRSAARRAPPLHGASGRKGVTPARTFSMRPA
jgi:uncharacterized protein